MELEYSTMSSEGSSVESELSHESTRLEEFHIEGVRLQLPQGLCENKSIFKEFFSHRTWHECFTEQQKQHLKVNNRVSISKIYFIFCSQLSTKAVGLFLHKWQVCNIIYACKNLSNVTIIFVFESCMQYFIALSIHRGPVYNSMYTVSASEEHTSSVRIVFTVMNSHVLITQLIFVNCETAVCLP
jgi:hypothetical protein